MNEKYRGGAGAAQVVWRCGGGAGRVEVQGQQQQQYGEEAVEVVVEVGDGGARG